ncbi:hypothetical protein CKALI_07885 [Corynebacterium kalinowskii]|uniref:DUF4245 domain-containing protein n=1 Tax=Corynebacterium kalinowskii TaxID=2675216 RepID=A0A6B8VHG2_9CORY|nr:DUF4245 domain-containing protein [Corynebacterium kalinowskii]QGU02439.1 hypothetical protein CKALI_07885 [Corynebacterium kalinowskii]
MADKKPRIFQDSRDIILSLLLVVGLMIPTVAFTGMCSFNPGAPENGPVKEVDAQQILSMEAKAMNFPVRLPANPEGWVTNSARRTTVNRQPATVLGWVTKEGAYVQLTQTDQPLDKAVQDVDEHGRTQQQPVEVDGQQFEVYTSADNNVRDVWATDLGDVRLVFSGTAGAAEFEQIARNTLQATPLPGKSN